MNERTPKERDRLGSVSRVITLAVTNAMKLAGVYVGLRAALQPTPNAVVLAFAGFMMAGAQVSESAVLGVIDRMFGSRNGKKGDGA